MLYPHLWWSCYANIDGITSKLEYWKEKLGFQQVVLLVPENEEKIMVCSFFKFSILEHFWVLKWIAWVDIRVVLIFYSFQGVRVDLEGELEKWTKCTQIGKLAKLQLIVIMIVFLAFQLKWYISNSKVKPPFAQCEFQMPPKKAKHGGARKKAGRKSKSGEFSNDKTPDEKLKSHRERLQYGCGNAERRCVNFLMNKFIICTI